MSIANWREWQLPDVHRTWDERDTILYALGIGCGAGGPDDLRFIRSFGAQALPTMAAVLGAPGPWFLAPEIGIDAARLLHGEHALTLHRPMPAAGSVTGRTQIAGVHDRGPGKGVALSLVRELTSADDGVPVATITDLLLLRGDEGAGADSGFRPVPRPPVPDRAPDMVRDQPTTLQSAHVYRLSGDTNPLHWDPAVAAAGGYPRPVLQGLATMGNVGRALLALACDDDPARLRALSLRFTAIVYPGDTIRTEAWRAADGLQFRARVVERDVVVVDGGVAVLG